MSSFFSQEKINVQSVYSLNQTVSQHATTTFTSNALNNGANKNHSVQTAKHTAQISNLAVQNV